MIGIYTRYCNCEATYLAVRLADWLRRRGLDVTVKADDKRPPRLRNSIDASVRSNVPVSFTTWAKQCSHVIWTHTPPYEQLRWVIEQDVKTAVVSVWDDFKHEYSQSLLTADVVLCTTKQRSTFLKSKWNVKNPIYLPWDNGLPFVRRSKRDRNYTVVTLPMFDREVHRMEATSVELAGRLLHRHQDVILLACYNSSTIASYAKRRIKRFRQIFGPQRVREMTGVDPQDRRFIYMQSDLTLWPCHTIGAGVVPVESLSMGTPVAGFLFKPLNEFLNQQNAVLSHTRGYTDADQMVHPQPDYVDLEQRLDAVITNRTHLEHLQSNATTGLAARRSIFNDVLSRLFK